MAGYTLPDGTHVIPPSHVQHGPGGMRVPENIRGINQYEEHRPIPQAPVMPQQSVIPQPGMQQPVQQTYPPTYPPGYPPAGPPAGPPMQPMQQEIYQQPTQIPAQNPAVASNQPPGEIVQMQVAPTPAFSIGGQQNANSEARAAVPAEATPVGPPDAGPSASELERLRAENAKLKQARLQEVSAMVKKATGTAENKALLDQWVDATLPAYEKRMINDVLSSGNLVEAQEVLNSLVTRYNQANAQPTQPMQSMQHPEYSQPNQPVFNPGAAPVAPVAGTYMSAQQYEAVMLTKEYNSNPAYAQQIDMQRKQSIAQDQSRQQPNGMFGRR